MSLRYVRKILDPDVSEIQTFVKYDSIPGNLMKWTFVLFLICEESVVCSKDNVDIW